ncbi:response regulator receiver protein [Calothrix sp. NIES-4071]|nr:response regulator receiver protein [Calothrix sp. NIES-4071]BAZ63479.1 response regulator receiver protein [Calothrix sp. NIES-4105]
MNILGTFTRLSSLSLLRHLSNCHDTTCLYVLSNSVTWLIYLEQGKIIYATHSIEPFDRLERHLRRLDHQLSALSTEIRVSVRLMFETDSSNLNGDSNPDRSPDVQPPEYQAICWLVSQRHINPTQAAILIQEMVKEVLESFSLLTTGNYKLISIVNKLPIICKIDTDKILRMCDQQLHGWQSLAPYISSPYQRPYLRVTTDILRQKLSTIHQNLTTWMKGFSLRHLAVIVNQDEVEMARQLHPYITSGEIVLHEPDPPFDKLPNFHLPKPAGHVSDLIENQLVIEAPRNLTETTTQRQIGSNVIIPAKTELRQQQTASQTVARESIPNTPSNTSVPETNRKVYKIVSVDDSPTVLREISRFLEHENFSVVTIDDPVKAVMSVIRNKPDLILLDLNMDGIDGYELCKIIRNNSMFKKTPIIMVTGNKGLVDKVKARLVGASGYLTKPFTQADLLKMVFMHLT